MASVWRTVIGIGAMLLANLAAAQTPSLLTPLPNRTATVGGTAVSIDLRDFFGLPGVTGTVVQFDTDFGKFNVELRNEAAPVTVANFLSYVNSGAYTNSMIHRSVPGFVIQGGGFLAQADLAGIPANAPIALESALPNVRGSIAMARTDVADSATTQWFINTVDNSASLAPGASGGYAVFGRVLGTGMTIVDTIAALPAGNIFPTFGNNHPFTETPVKNYTGGSLTVANLVAVKSITSAAVYPSESAGLAVLSFEVQSAAPSVASVSLSGSTLTVTPGAQTGSATVNVSVTDTDGNVASGSFTLTVQKLAQTITFAGPTDRPFSLEALALSASSTSDLPVSFSRVSGPATLQGSTLTLTGTGTVTIRATQDGNEQYAAADPVERSFVVTPNFLSWSATRFSVDEMASSAVSGPNVILAGDGLPNLIKYALGLEPRVAAPSPLSVSATAEYWVCTYTRPADRAELGYHIDSSVNLVDWVDTGAAHERVTSADGWETWRARVDRTAGSRMFFRLRVTQP